MSIFDGLKQRLYELSSYIPDSGKKAIANIALAGTVAFTGVAVYGCTKDEKPPVIQHEIGDWAVEDENINPKVNTFDDRGVEEVYIQFDGGDKIPLKKTYSEKNGGEKATWESSFKLSPKDYLYSIVARDKAGNESDPKEGEGKITVYSKDKKAFIGLLTKYPKAIENVPGLYCAISCLQDISISEDRLEERDAKAVERIFSLASDPKYKTSFEQIIDDNLVEPLFWIALDRGFDQPNTNPLEGFSPEKLLDEAWKNTSSSKNYGWNNFVDVTEILKGSPIAITKYMKNNFSNYGLCPEKWAGMHKVDNYMFQPAEKTFKERGGDPTDLSIFALSCLLKDEMWRYDNFETYKDNATCVLIAFRGNSFGKDVSDVDPKHIRGSSSVLYIKNGLFYEIQMDFIEIKGPFSTISNAADATYPGSLYMIQDLNKYENYELLNIDNKYNKNTIK